MAWSQGFAGDILQLPWTLQPASVHDRSDLPVEKILSSKQIRICCVSHQNGHYLPDKSCVK